MATSNTHIFKIPQYSFESELMLGKAGAYLDKHSSTPATLRELQLRVYSVADLLISSANFAVAMFLCFQ